MHAPPTPGPELVPHMPWLHDWPLGQDEQDAPALPQLVAV
jgi:hypothetical protein